MNRRRLRWKVIGLLAAAILLTVAVILWQQQRKLSLYQVTVAEAQTVVERFIIDSDWERDQVILQEKLYNLRNEVTAYLFEHHVNGNYERYIIISATRTKPPVVEYSANQLYRPSADKPKGFYFAPYVVHEKSLLTLMLKKWYAFPLLLPHYFETRIDQKVESYKASWEYYLGS